MVGLIGPDGVGKSSVLSLIAGARQIQAGAVQVLGGDMASARYRTQLCPRVAYMPQGLGSNLYPDLTVQENIAFFSRLFGQAGAERAWRTAELLDATGLAPFADRPPRNLSGGMRQKLGLCCSLIHDPDLLILDEPTTGVDPLSRRQFWTLVDLMRSRRPAMSVVVATAYMEEAERFDWLIAMNAGRVLASGSPAALKASTGTATVEEAFIAVLPEVLRHGHTTLVIPPRAATDAAPVIVARDLTVRFGDFHRRRPRQLQHPARRDLRLPRLQRLRQNHHHEGADRPAARHRAAQCCCSANRSMSATCRRGRGSATCRSPSRSIPS